ncbi:hypothetical protein ACJVDH_12560 [Pedobacter sp. AW1-32]|uniref:hypothetical protein n=1 Tax=Pedobacter sp. AW1-32 TaxID=3383026 RepID=UPI003FED7CA3
MSFNNLVVILSCLLLAVLVFREVRRTNKQFLFLRILSSVLLIAAFAAMVLPVRYSTDKLEKINELKIITNGFPDDSLKNISGKYFYTDSSLSKKVKQNATFIPDLAYYLADHPEIDAVSALGYGLATDDLKKLGNRKFSFRKTGEVHGFLHANWNSNLKEDEVLIVQGTFKNSLNKNIRLKLSGFGLTLDSAEVKASATRNFELKHQIKQSGQSILYVIAVDGRDTLFKEPLPVQSAISEPIKILMLTSFPGFEYNFLKKWLYENKFPVAVRSQISKNKFSTDFMNVDVQNLEQINGASLKNKDVLIIDQQEFEALAEAERKNIMHAVSDGMGFILLVNGEKSVLPLINKLKFISKDKPDKLLYLTLPFKQLTLSGLPANQQIFLSAQPNQQQIAQSSDQYILAAQTIYGSGKLIYSTLESSYEWILAGKKSDYAKYWSTLISAAARKHQPKIIFKNVEQLPRLAEKQTVNFELPTLDYPTIKYGNKPLRANQNLWFPNAWTVQAYAEESGWNTVEINGKKLSFYVYNTSDWQSPVIQKTIIENNNYAEIKKIENSATEVSQTQQIEVSKWIFLCILVFSAGFLWMENRMIDNN